MNFTDEEREMIQGWYQSAAWESATCSDKESCEKLLSLLQKFGFEVDPMDVSHMRGQGIEI